LPLRASWPGALLRAFIIARIAELRSPPPCVDAPDPRGAASPRPRYRRLTTRRPASVRRRQASQRLGGLRLRRWRARASSLAAFSTPLARAPRRRRGRAAPALRAGALFGQLFFLAAQQLGVLAASSRGVRARLVDHRSSRWRRLVGFGASSRLTKVRFLRTSTWIVRALPDASACLISLVLLRVMLIFLRSLLATLPCSNAGVRAGAPCRRRSVRRRPIAWQRQPTALVQQRGGRGFSSAASCATVVTAIVGILVGVRRAALEFGQVFQSLNQCARACMINTLPGCRPWRLSRSARRRQVGRSSRVWMPPRPAANQLGRQALPSTSRSRKSCDTLRRSLPGRSPSQQRVLGTGGKLVDGAFVEALDLEHFLHRHVGHLFQAGEALGDQMSATSWSTSSLSTNSFLTESDSWACLALDSSAVMMLIASGQIRRQAHVLAAAADRYRQIFLVDHHVHRVALSSTTIDCTLAGANAPMTNCAGSSDTNTISTRSPASSLSRP